MSDYDLITILGPTASGKTRLAVALAYELNTEIISADSRQLYQSMNVGTGKDLADYIINGKQIPYHLIDIVEPGYKYNVFEYQRDFLKAYHTIKQKGKIPILCGGTGMYIEAVLKGYKFPRAVRAIEIEEYDTANARLQRDFPTLKSLIIGVDIDRETRRQRITARLRQRLGDGLIDEVKTLLNNGVKPEDLIYYGLEYKYVTLHSMGQLSYEEMFVRLEIAIHQFAKRQMTWFRGMERKGFSIHWVKGLEEIEELMKGKN